MTNLDIASTTRPVHPEQHMIDPNSPEARAARAGDAVDYQPAPFVEHVEPEPGAPPAAAPPAPAAREERRDPDQPPLRVDPRNAIYARTRETRPAAAPEARLNIEMMGLPEGVPVVERDEDFIDETDNTPRERGAVEEAVPRKAAHDPVQTDLLQHSAPQSFQLKVNGNQFAVSREDALRYAGLDEETARGIPDVAIARAAQINLAAEQRLLDAKQESSSARTAAPGGVGHQANVGQQPAPVQSPSPPEEDEEALLERVQIGEPAEAKKALDALIQRGVQRTLGQTQAQQTMQSMQREVDEAVDAFAAANKDIASDPFLGDAHMTAAVHEAVKELQEKVPAMVTPEVALKLRQNPGAALQAYQAARIDGAPLRRPSEIFDAAAAQVRSRFVSPQPARHDPPPAAAPASRVEEKRRLIQQPTRSDTVSMDATQGRPARRNPSDVIRAEAARRDRMRG